MVPEVTGLRDRKQVTRLRKRIGDRSAIPDRRSKDLFNGVHVEGY
jgi:hypothetical protein